MNYRSIVSIAFGLAVTVVFYGCSVIDEDLSDCDEEMRLDYDLHLVTNLTIELQKELDRKDDANLLKALRSYLAPIFTDYARDIDLSFYDVQGDGALLHNERHQMDANEMSYTLYLPRRQYHHTALANLEGNGVVMLEGGDHYHSTRLLQSRGDTVSTHKTGVFTARKEIQVDIKTVYVHLYMANCAAALVLDTSEATLKDLKVLATGFASGFNIADSSYVYVATSQLVMADKVDTGTPGQACFCTVNFPSPESPKTTRNIIETEEPFDTSESEKPLWQFRVYATLSDGKVTESVLSVNTSLSAGQLDIIRAKVHSNGALEPDGTKVGVSVTLDWNEAGHHEIPL
jgi:hypothetical protein